MYICNMSLGHAPATYFFSTVCARFDSVPATRARYISLRHDPLVLTTRDNCPCYVVAT